MGLQIKPCREVEDLRNQQENSEQILVSEQWRWEVSGVGSAVKVYRVGKIQTQMQVLNHFIVNGVTQSPRGRRACGEPSTVLPLGGCLVGLSENNGTLGNLPGLPWVTHHSICKCHKSLPWACAQS